MRAILCLRFVVVDKSKDLLLKKMFIEKQTDVAVNQQKLLTILHELSQYNNPQIKKTNTKCCNDTFTTSDNAKLDLNVLNKRLMSA